jgi:hypothetical protein
MEKKYQNIVIIILFIIAYITIDIAMDKILFPMLAEPLKQHHIEIVKQYNIFFNLIWVWLVGFIYFKNIYDEQKGRLTKLALVFFGSALFSSIVFAFTSLPFIWIASTFPLLSSIFLFLHDHGLFVYFFIMIIFFGYKYYIRSIV